MLKSIGVLTWHRTTNPGAVLQAYSQALALQERFPDKHVRIVDLRHGQRAHWHIREIASEFVRGRISTIRENHVYARAVSRYLPVDTAPVRSDQYRSILAELDARYDALIVGSDELWKTLAARSGAAFPNPFFLSPHLSAKKIALAVSANGCTLDDIPLNRRPLALQLVNGFDFVGVRDDHTRSLLHGLGVPMTTVHKVPDPTFTFRPPVNSTPAVERVFNRSGLRDERKTLGIYGYFDSPKLANCLREVSAAFENRGWQVVSLKYNQAIAGVSVHGRLDPFQWAAAFEKLDLCITNTFHGTIFSMLSGTPVFSIEDGDYYKENKGKIADVLEEMDLIENYCHFSDVGSSRRLFDRALSVKNDWEPSVVAQRLSYMRQLYLDNLNLVADIIDP